jgi:NADH-quinone oxidoreductase subunit J
MTATVIAFYVISGFILAGGLLAVTSRKIFRSAIWLLLSLSGIAALYIWMDLLFLAAVQIVVYMGGIVVLIIFSIFLTAQTGADLPAALNRRKILSALLAFAGFAITGCLFLIYPFSVSESVFNSSVSDIGRKMLHTGEGGFALPFEVVSVLLLAAMIGCIAIAIKSKPENS